MKNSSIQFIISISILRLSLHYQLQSSIITTYKLHLAHNITAAISHATWHTYRSYHNEVMKMIYNKNLTQKTKSGTFYQWSSCNKLAVFTFKKKKKDQSVNCVLHLSFMMYWNISTLVVKKNYETTKRIYNKYRGHVFLNQKMTMGLRTGCTLV